MKDDLKRTKEIKDTDQYQYRNASARYLNEMHEYLYQEIDFGIFHHSAVMQFAENLGP